MGGGRGVNVQEEERGMKGDRGGSCSTTRGHEPCFPGIRSPPLLTKTQDHTSCSSPHPREMSPGGKAPGKGAVPARSTARSWTVTAAAL